MRGSIPHVEVDQDKCETPYECKICLQICPQAVFSVVPTQVERLVETNPEGYEVKATFVDKCILCMDCADACPENAIKVKEQGEE